MAKGTYEYRPVVGDVIKLDARTCSDRLIECDDFPAEYRLTGHCADLPVRIEITGRVIRWDAPRMRGAACVRCRVVFLTDGGEPEPVECNWARGWVVVY